MAEPGKLIVMHGSFRKLKSFRVAQLVYDLMVRFCDRYIEKRSRALAALRESPMGSCHRGGTFKSFFFRQKPPLS